MAVVCDVPLALSSACWSRIGTSLFLDAAPFDVTGSVHLRQGAGVDAAVSTAVPRSRGAKYMPPDIERVA